MILYTVVPPEAVWEEEAERRFIEVEVNGVRLLAEPLDGTTAKVERVLSTDPSHFLDPRLQPGSTVRLP